MIKAAQQHKLRAPKQQTKIILHPHTQANNTTQRQNNETKHKTKAQSIDIEKRSEADRVEH